MADDGQGWHGDSEGHAEAAKGNSTNDSDDEGLVDKVKSAFSGSDDDSGSDSSNKGQGQGWHGDSEGHAEAAKEGHENS